MLRILFRIIDSFCGVDEHFSEDDYDLFCRRWNYEQQFSSRTLEELEELHGSLSYRNDKAFRLAINHSTFEKRRMKKQQERTGIKLVVDNTR